MEIIFYNKDFFNIKTLAVTVGNFDGVHKGHQKLISQMVNYGRKHNIKTAVLTFYNKINPPLGLISHPLRKRKLISELGADYLIYLDFKEFCNMEAESYIKDFLVGTLDVKAIFYSEGHKFGKMAKGDGRLLEKMGREYGFESYCVPLLIKDGQRVCSSAVRELLKQGDIEKANEMLGYRFSYKLSVVRGHQLGRTMGFPTINQNIDKGMIVLEKGVYATVTYINKKPYPSVTNVGIKPTVTDHRLNMETHIINHDEDLYDKEIKVEFLKKLRDEKKFDSLEKLKEAINENCNQAVEIYKKEMIN